MVKDTRRHQEEGKIPVEVEEKQNNLTNQEEDKLEQDFHEQGIRMQNTYEELNQEEQIHEVDSHEGANNEVDFHKEANLEAVMHHESKEETKEIAMPSAYHFDPNDISNKQT